MRRFALVLLMALAACSDNPAAPNPYGAALPISVTPVDQPIDDLPHVLIGFDNTLLTLYGKIVTPDPCYDLSAYRTLAGNELKITIVAKPQRQRCASSVDHFDFQVLSDSPACPHVTVWYHYEGVDWPDVQVGERYVICAAASAPSLTPPGA